MRLDVCELNLKALWLLGLSLSLPFSFEFSVFGAFKSDFKD